MYTHTTFCKQSFSRSQGASEVTILLTMFTHIKQQRRETTMNNKLYSISRHYQVNE